MRLPKPRSGRSNIAVFFSLFVSLAVIAAACRTAPEDVDVPETAPPAIQPGAVAIEQEQPDPVAEGAPEWHDYRDEGKFDAALQSRLHQLEEQGREDTVRVLVELRDAFNPEIHEHMQGIGLRLFTTEGYIIVAQGTPDDLRTVTAFDYVARVTLSQ